MPQTRLKRNRRISTKLKDSFISLRDIGIISSKRHLTNSGMVQVEGRTKFMKTEDLMRELLYGYKPPFDETNNIESENTENEVTLRKYRIILPSNWAKMSEDEILTYLSLNYPDLDLKELFQHNQKKKLPQLPDGSRLMSEEALNIFFQDVNNNASN